jgi:ABC-2 type transport system ATP-binding protein
MEQADYILKTQGISKSYGAIEALKDVNLNFSDEKIYGLYGRNGAGKTTLLDIISTRLFADNGNVICFGDDISAHPEVIADTCCYMPEKHYFPGRLKVRQLLAYGRLAYPDYNEPYAKNLCRNFNLNVDQKYEQLSRGYQSIFRIVLGLAANARITIFDEPVLGLDAVARDSFYSELIEEFTRNPRLFIISTHLIEESADLFNEAIILKNGSVIRQASVEELLANAFYVSGKSDSVNKYIKDRTVISKQIVDNIATAVVDGELDKQSRTPDLHYSPISIQKLFIHLTNDKTEQEQGYE